MLVLKQQLKQARPSQTAVATTISVSGATLAQIVDHNPWARTNAGEIRQRLQNVPARHGIETEKSFNTLQDAPSHAAQTTDLSLEAFLTVMLGRAGNTLADVIDALRVRLSNQVGAR
ncbi:hypothetical protein [Brenneria rubrifaciens]|uniref:hypothetical protein n=1 Tax=Brenneria rubrifaciens TaxID=55213 RepID=UPI0026B050E6